MRKEVEDWMSVTQRIAWEERLDTQINDDPSGKRDTYSWRNVEGIGGDISFFNPQITIARMLGNAGYPISVGTRQGVMPNPHLQEVTVRATVAARDALWSVLYNPDVVVITSAVSGEPELVEKGLEKEVRWDDETRSRLLALSHEQKAVQLRQNAAAEQGKAKKTANSAWEETLLERKKANDESAKQAQREAAKYWELAPAFSKEELTEMIGKVVSDYTKDHPSV